MQRLARNVQQVKLIMQSLARTTDHVMLGGQLPARKAKHREAQRPKPKQRIPNSCTRLLLVVTFVGVTLGEFNFDDLLVHSEFFFI